MSNIEVISMIISYVTCLIGVNLYVRCFRVSGARYSIFPFPEFIVSAFFLNSICLVLAFPRWGSFDFIELALLPPFIGLLATRLCHKIFKVNISQRPGETLYDEKFDLNQYPDE